MPALPLLDELMANAWPPVAVERHDGWRFRWSNGVTRRANSALAVGGDDVAALLAHAESFYEARGAPPLLQVTTASAPPTLARYLEAGGYRPTARTFVARAVTSDVVSRTDAGSHDVESEDSPTDEWFDAYWSVESTRGRSDADRATCREVLLAPSLPTVFALARDDSDVVGVGQVVIERGWGGVQCMATRTANRRRGVARAVLHALAKAAFQQGARDMYLAVMADNAAGQELYERSGFHRVHEYSYFSPQCRP